MGSQGSGSRLAVRPAREPSARRRSGEAFLTLRSFVRAVSRRGALLAQGAENSRVCGLQAWMNQGAKALFHPLSSLDWRHSKAGFSQQEV